MQKRHVTPSRALPSDIARLRRADITTYHVHVAHASQHDADGVSWHHVRVEHDWHGGASFAQHGAHDVPTRAYAARLAHVWYHACVSATE